MSEIVRILLIAAIFRCEYAIYISGGLQTVDLRCVFSRDSAIHSQYRCRLLYGLVYLLCMCFFRDTTLPLRECVSITCLQWVRVQIPVCCAYVVLIKL